MSAPALSAADYPNIIARIPVLANGIARVACVSVCRQWVRDMPAVVLRPRGGRPVALLYTDGFRTHHNRYVRRGTFPAYHLSDGVTTASAEVFGVAASPRAPHGPPKTSRLQLLVHADLRAVLDLTDKKVRQALQITKDELTVLPDWSVLASKDRPSAYELTQAIGELAHAAGRDGILYPAARARPGVNLVVFTDHLAATGGSLRTTNPATGEDECLPPCP